MSSATRSSTSTRSAERSRGCSGRDEAVRRAQRGSDEGFENMPWWEGQDSNLRRLRRRFYRPLPLATRAPSRESRSTRASRSDRLSAMAKDQFSFDVVSEVNPAEIRNAVDQAEREI